MKRTVVLLATLLLSFGLIQGQVRNVDIDVELTNDSLRIGQPSKLMISLEQDYVLGGMSLGFEVFTATGEKDYVAEKAETATGWLFPVGDEVNALGYDTMFTDMFDAIDLGRPPMETFYDGYVVNAIMDACYASAGSKRWEPVELDPWRGSVEEKKGPRLRKYNEQYYLIKEEKLPDGTTKLILKDMKTGKIIQKTK